MYESKYEEYEYDVLRHVDNQIKSNHFLPLNKEQTFVAGFKVITEIDNNHVI